MTLNYSVIVFQPICSKRRVILVDDMKNTSISSNFTVLPSKFQNFVNSDLLHLDI